MDPYRNSSPARNGPTPQDNHMTFRTPQKVPKSQQKPNPTPVTFQRSSTPNIGSIQEKNREHEKQMGVAYSWGSLCNRQSQYYGKILHTQYTKQPPATHNPKLPHINQLNYVAKTHNKYRKYRHGPGILALNDNVWVIGKWRYGGITGRKCYAVGGDFGVLQLRLAPSVPGAHSNNNWDMKGLQVEEMCYVGNGTKNGEQTAKYIVMGTKNREGRWKWVITSSNTHTQHLYLQTQDAADPNNRSNELSTKIIQHRVVKQSSKSGDSDRELGVDMGNMRQLADYEYIVGSIRHILTDDDAVGGEEGFNIQEQRVQVINNKQAMDPHKVEVKEEAIIDTLVYGNFGGQRIVMNIKSTAHDVWGDARFRWFNIDSIGTYTTNVLNPSHNDGKLILGNRDYVYKVKNISEGSAKDGSIPMLPAIQVQERINNNEGIYRYTCSYNIFNSDPCLYAPPAGEYQQSLKQKARRNLRSLQFENSSDHKLCHQIRQVIIKAQTAYFHARQLAPSPRKQSQSRQKQYALTDRLPERTRICQVSDGLQCLGIGYNPDRLNVSESRVDDWKRELENIRVKARQREAKKKVAKEEGKGKIGKIVYKISPPKQQPFKKSKLNVTMPIAQKQRSRQKFIQSLYQNQPHRLQSALSSIISAKKSPTGPQYPSQYPQHFTQSNPQLLELAHQYRDIDRQLTEHSIKSRIPIQKVHLGCHKKNKEIINRSMYLLQEKKDKEKDAGKRDKYSKIGIQESRVQKSKIVLKTYL